MKKKLQSVIFSEINCIIVNLKHTAEIIAQNVCRLGEQLNINPLTDACTIIQSKMSTHQLHVIHPFQCQSFVSILTTSSQYDNIHVEKRFTFSIYLKGCPIK